MLGHVDLADAADLALPGHGGFGGKSSDSRRRDEELAALQRDHAGECIRLRGGGGVAIGAATRGRAADPTNRCDRMRREPARLAISTSD